MIFEINEENPQKRLMSKAVDILEEGGIVVIPTDTVYAYACDIRSKNAIERLYRIKKMDRKKPLSFIFDDIASVAEYVRNMSTQAFKIMKRAFPGPYTFIFNASKVVPKIVLTNQKTIGVRIPDNSISQWLVRGLGRPILVSSVENSEGEFVISPAEIEKRHHHLIDLVIDSGPGITELSTIVDFTKDKIDVLREGKGDLFFT